VQEEEKSHENPDQESGWYGRSSDLYIDKQSVYMAMTCSRKAGPVFVEQVKEIILMQKRYSGPQIAAFEQESNGRQYGSLMIHDGASH
jgi:hypothetical protein